MPRESNFKKKVLRDLKCLPETWFFKSQERARRGVPDIIACIRGYFVAIELKADESEKPTELQMHTLKKIAESGGLACVCFPEAWPEMYKTLYGLAHGELNDYENVVVYGYFH